MKKIKYNRVFQILYPLIVYYIFYNGFYSLFDFLFNDLSDLFCLFLSGLVTLIPIFFIYKKSPKYEMTSLEKNSLFNGLFLIVITVFVGLLLNVIITHTGLIDSSNGFSKANETLSSGSFILKIFCNAIVIPLLEETLYRGIIEGQLLIMTSPYFAIIFSSFCFGFLHFNIVQFLYAFIVGLILGFSYYKTKNLWVVILAHGLTNLIVIIFS